MHLYSIKAKLLKVYVPSAFITTTDQIRYNIINAASYTDCLCTNLTDAKTVATEKFYLQMISGFARILFLQDYNFPALFLMFTAIKILYICVSHMS